MKRGLQGIDEGIAQAGLPLPPNEPDEADEPFDDFGTLDPPATLDLRSAGISAVVWATGVTGNFGYLPEGATTDGRPAHRRGS